MARALTFKELEKISNDTGKELHQLKQHLNLLQINIAESERHLHTHEALVECVDLLLNKERFINIAHHIYCKCKGILGATSGYVAVVDQSGKCLDVLHLDTGGMKCTVDYEGTMPIRGLRKETLQKKTCMYCNNFNRSKWLKFLPRGHVQLQNVLFAPLVIEDVSVGLLGFANKSKDFDPEDRRIASSFAKLAALALYHSKAWLVMKGIRLDKSA